MYICPTDSGNGELELVAGVLSRPIEMDREKLPNDLLGA
jgi:hypothetical protein